LVVVVTRVFCKKTSQGGACGTSTHQSLGRLGRNHGYVSQLEAHERECAIRYASFEDKLDHIDKRLWRLEALMMASTLTIVAEAVGLFLR
jgi:hypothetical protein